MSGESKVTASLAARLQSLSLAACALAALPALAQFTGPGAPAVSTLAPSSPSRGNSLRDVDELNRDETRSDGTPFTPEQLLLSLQLQERTLLEDYGAQHPRVLALRARLRIVQDILTKQAAARMVVSPSPPSAAPIIHAIHTEPVPLQERVDVRYDGSGGGWFDAAETHAPLPGVPRSVPANLPGAPMPSAPAVKQEAAVAAPREAAAPSGTPSSLALATRWAGLVAAALLALCLHVATLAFLLRHCGIRLSAPLPVQFVHASASAEPPVRAAALPRADERNTEPAAAPAGVLDQQEQARRRQEAAVFQQVFEDNVQLREQLCRLPGAAV